MKTLFLFLSSFVIALGFTALMYFGFARIHQPLRDAVFSTEPEQRAEALVNAVEYEKAHFPAIFGNRTAQEKLGRMFMTGQMGTPDPQKGLYWYERAARQGSDTAMLALGYAYETDEGGVRKNIREALHWYKAAHDAGNLQGTNNLALVYMKGLSDKADYTSAMTLFKDAAAKGSGQAAMNLARLAFLGLGMEKNDAIGAAWVQEAANSGAESAAQALMGILYLGGIGVPQDFNKARQWLQTSSEPEAEELATQIAMMGNAVDILPPEEKEAAWEKIYAEAEADIREAFNAILEKGTAPRSSYKGRK